MEAFWNSCIDNLLQGWICQKPLDDREKSTVANLQNMDTVRKILVSKLAIIIAEVLTKVVYICSKSKQRTRWLRYWVLKSRNHPGLDIVASPFSLSRQQRVPLAIK
jgi:hypothetical protein